MSKSAFIFQIIGTHDYSFHDVLPDDVLHGELHVQTMDYISQILKVQFNCQYGMMPPSYIYQLDLSNFAGNFQKVPPGVSAVQIHFVMNHYIVSTQTNKQIYVYDSLLNSAHLETVKSQLSIVYETLENEPILISPQSQGSTVLCGFFAIANAVTLLKKGDPSKLNFKTDQMRKHLQMCLVTGKVENFPQTALPAKKPQTDPITAYLKRSESKAGHKTSTQ